MEKNNIVSAVKRLDCRTALEIENAWVELRPLGCGVTPFLLAAFPSFKSAAGRLSLVFYSTRYSRISHDAFNLGILALGDRSKNVRDRACGLLAYSLCDHAIEPLAKLLCDPALQVREAANAAINAIRQRNRHLFVDRQATGRSFWVVNPGDH